MVRVKSDAACAGAGQQSGSLAEQLLGYHDPDAGTGCLHPDLRRVAAVGQQNRTERQHDKDAV